MAGRPKLQAKRDAMGEEDKLYSLVDRVADETVRGMPGMELPYTWTETEANQTDPAVIRAVRMRCLLRESYRMMVYSMLDQGWATHHIIPCMLVGLDGGAAAVSKQITAMTQQVRQIPKKPTSTEAMSEEDLATFTANSRAESHDGL